MKPLEIKELHSVILALLPKNRMIESDNAPPKLELTTNIYHPPSSSQQEGKEQRSCSDYKSVPSSSIPSGQRIDLSSSVPSGQRIELLVVDDSRRNRRLMIKTLVLAGFVCEEADDGQNAVNMVCPHTLFVFFILLHFFIITTLTHCIITNDLIL